MKFKRCIVYFIIENLCNLLNCTFWWIFGNEVSYKTCSFHRFFNWNLYVRFIHIKKKCRGTPNLCTTHVFKGILEFKSGILLWWLTNFLYGHWSSGIGAINFVIIWPHVIKELYDYVIGQKSFKIIILPCLMPIGI